MRSNGVSNSAITALVVDDEPLARTRITSLLKTDPEVNLVGECGDGTSAITAIQQLTPSLVFLDVEMPEVDGFGVLRALDVLPTIVFVTAHPTYAIPAFEACALDYLLKPFKRSRFFNVLARAKNHIRRNIECDSRDAAIRQLIDAQQPCELLIVKSEGRLLFLRMSEVRWIEADKDYIRLHLLKGTHLVRETMNGVQKRLDPAVFVRIHRSSIVNIHEISEVEPMLGGDYRVVLRDRTQLNMSRRYRFALDDLLRQCRVSLAKCT
jgi:two-component system, LytTR family, response regulator